jgi:hypothetical protein
LVILGVPREREAISSVLALDRNAQEFGGTEGDLRQLSGVKIKAAVMPKQSRKGEVRSQPASSRRGETRQVERSSWPTGLAHQDVELEVLHGRVEDFLDDVVEPVDFVDEQDVARFEVGQDGGEVAGALDHGARGVDVHAQFVRDHVSERGLAPDPEGSRRGNDPGFPFAGRLDEERAFPDAGLAEVVGEGVRTQRGSNAASSS